MSVAASALRLVLSGALARVPPAVVHGAGALAADLVWRRRGARVVQLESTLSRAVPGATPARLRALSREGLRSYARYWCGMVTVPRLGRGPLLASVDAHGLEPLAAELAAGRGVVVALGHLGSWDHLGAWAAAALAPVTTVAERTEDPGLFEAFASARSRAGITALPLDDPATALALRRALRGGHLVALLADRDLTGSGVKVDLLGSRAAFARGPATLALAGGARLFFAGCTYRRLPSPWWTFSPWRRWALDVRITEVSVPPPHDAEPGASRRAAREAAVVAATQGCADALGASVRERPGDWHVLQPVFLDDVDAGARRSPAGRPAPVEPVGA